MSVVSTEIELNRIFYSPTSYSPNPPGSLYYTTGESVEITSGDYAGLYSVGLLVESDIAGLYDIPNFGRTALTSDIVDYAVDEDATTLNPANYQGGSGQITIQTRPFNDAEEFFTASLTLRDSFNGDAQGTVRGLDIHETGTSVTADSLTALFNVHRVLPTSQQTLRNAFTTYFQVAGVSLSVTYEDNLGNLPVHLTSQEGNVWDILKQIASAYQFEMAFVGSGMVIRKPRKLEITTDRSMTFQRSINAQDVSKKVRVHYYSNAYFSHKEVYPVPDQPADIKEQGEEFTPSEPTIYTVDAGETVRVTLDLQASLFSVNQPQYQSFVSPNSYDNSAGVYSAVGNDDLPISPEQWVAQGGSLRLRVLENQKQIEMTLIGPKNKSLAPYRIAVSSGDGNYYNALRITGTGLLIEDNYIDLVTGATDMTTAEDVGLEVTNPYIGTLAHAIGAGQFAAAGKALTYSVSTQGYLFNPGDMTFGKVAGARLRTNNSVFRVDTARTGPASSDLTASQDVLIGDINEVYDGMTMGEVSSAWAGRTMLDFSLAPLRNE